MNKQVGSETSPRTLYVGNLHQDVTEELIVALFSTLGACHGCKIIREPGNDPYCFVEYSEHSEAAAALSAMNKRLCLGKELKVNWASSPGNTPKVDTSKHFHIFVGDLSPDIETHQLRDAFMPFGSISDVKIIRDAQTLKSKGFGFVSFVKKEDAENAISGMNGQWIGTRPIRTNWATRKPPAPIQKENYKQLDYDTVYTQASDLNCTVYVGGLIITDEDNNLQPFEEMIQEHFEEFGTIEETRLFKDKGYAFVRYAKKDCACKAIVQRNGTILNGLTLKCSWGKEMGGLGPSKDKTPTAYSTATPAAGTNYPPTYSSQGQYGSYNYGYWPGYGYPPNYQQPQGYSYPPYPYMQGGYGYGYPPGQQGPPKDSDSTPPPPTAENTSNSPQNDNSNSNNQRDSQGRESSLPPPPPPLPYQDSRDSELKDNRHSSSHESSRYHPYEKNNGDQNGQFKHAPSRSNVSDYSYNSNSSTDRYDESRSGPPSNTNYGNSTRYQDSNDSYNSDPYYQQYSGNESSKQYSGNESSKQYSGNGSSRQYSGNESTRQYSGNESSKQYSGNESSKQYSGNESYKQYSGNEPSKDYERSRYDSYRESNYNNKQPGNLNRNDDDDDNGRYHSSSHQDRDYNSRNSKDEYSNYSDLPYSRYGDSSNQKSYDGYETRY